MKTLARKLWEKILDAWSRPSPVPLAAAFAALAVVCVATIASAVVAGPIDPSSTAAALSAGIEAAGDLAAHKFQPAVAILLMLLVWAGHQPFAGSFLDRLGRWHNPILLGIGGALSAVADHLLAGGPWTVSVVMGVLSPILATGTWEHLTHPKDAPAEAKAELVLAAVNDFAAKFENETDPAKKLEAAAAVVNASRG